MPATQISVDGFNRCMDLKVPFADLLSRIDRVEDRGRKTDLEIDMADLPELS